MIAAIALLLDWMLGEPARWHPIVGFGRWARYLERHLNVPLRAGVQRLSGVGAVILAVAPFVLVAALLRRGPISSAIVDTIALYVAVAHRSLREHAVSVHEALQSGDLPAARERVSFLVSRDVSSMDRDAVTVATVESVLENGNDAVFGALFWFALAGAPGVVLYRLVNTLDAEWGYRTPRYLNFGWAAARLDDVLNFVPARLTALSYAIVGRTRTALQCWRGQARMWDSPNAGPVIAAGAGALGVTLGGGAFYHGHWRERAVLGLGAAPDERSIPAAIRLVSVALLVWILVIVSADIAIRVWSNG